MADAISNDALSSHITPGSNENVQFSKGIVAIRPFEKVEKIEGKGNGFEYTGEPLVLGILDFQSLKDTVCKICKKTGHIAKKCPDNRCFTCGEQGHAKKNCPACKHCRQIVDHAGQTCPEITCKACSEKGHVKRDCPSTKKAGRLGRKPKCAQCNEVGHSTIDCPKEGNCTICGGSDHNTSICGLNNEVPLATTSQDTEESAPAAEAPVGETPASAADEHTTEAASVPPGEDAPTTATDPASDSGAGGWGFAQAAEVSGDWDKVPDSAAAETSASTTAPTDLKQFQQAVQVAAETVDFSNDTCFNCELELPHLPDPDSHVTVSSITEEQREKVIAGAISAKSDLSSEELRARVRSVRDGSANGVLLLYALYRLYIASNGKIGDNFRAVVAAFESPVETESADVPNARSLGKRGVEQIEAKLILYHEPEHIAAMELQLMLPTTDRSAQSVVCARFTAANLQGKIRCYKVDTANPDAVRSLHSSCPSAEIERLTADDEVYAIWFNVDMLEMANGESMLGRALFTRSAVMETHPEIQVLRDRLASGPCQFVFLERGNEAVLEKFNKFWSVYRPQKEDEERKQIPIVVQKWWPEGFNVQGGQGIVHDDTWPSFHIPPRPQFDYMPEYATVHFYNAQSELLRIQDTTVFKSRIRFVKFPQGGKNLFIGCIERSQDATLSNGSQLTIHFDEGSGRAADWKAEVIEPLPFVPGQDYTTFVKRPREKQPDGTKAFTALELPEGSFIEATSLGSSHELREALLELPGLACVVTEHASTSGVTNQINTLRHFCLNDDKGSFKIEKQVIFGNDYLNLEALNYFQEDIDQYSEEQVESVLETILSQCSEDQKKAFKDIKELNGFIGLIQGVGGTGKSTFLLLLLRYHYLLNAPSGTPSRIWFHSAFNKHLDKFANDAAEALLAEYNRLKESGENPKYPSVLRRYMHATETKIYTNNARNDARALAQEDPELYWDSSNAEDVDNLENFIVLADINRAYIENKTPFADKRVLSVHLSEGEAMLYRAGVPDKDGNMHPTADPDLAKHAEFRNYLDRIRRGEKLDADEKKKLTNAANKLAADVARNADIICQTSDVVTQQRAHKGSNARAVWVDEAGKLQELSTLATIVWAVPYTGGGSAGPVNLTERRPPVIMTGDIFQPNPALVISRTEKVAPFHDQVSLSLFHRLIQCGSKTTYFWEQYRYCPDICDMVNYVLELGGRLTAAPSTQALDDLQLVTKFFREHLGVPCNIAFMSSKKGDAEVNESSKSTYNITNCRRAWYYAMEMVKFGIKPSLIGFIVPYNAQLAVYRTALARFLDWVVRTAGVSPDFKDKLEEMKNATLTTQDSIQGGQVGVLIWDTVINKSLKFLADDPRIYLAITRARLGMIVVGDAAGVENFYANKQWAYKKSAYRRVVAYCKAKLCYRDIDDQKLLALSNGKDVRFAPFDSASIRGVHTPRDRDINPVPLFPGEAQDIAGAAPTDFGGVDEFGEEGDAFQPNEQAGEGTWVADEQAGEGTWVADEQTNPIDVADEQTNPTDVDPHDTD